MNDNNARQNLVEKLAALESYGVGTWEDLSLMMEGLIGRHLDISTNDEALSLEEFLEKTKRSVAVVSYRLAPDSLGNELVKTAWALRKTLETEKEPTATIHWIAGRILPYTPHIKGPKNEYYQIPGFGGFDQWKDAYHQLFGIKLERSHEAYRSLPQFIWKQTLKLAARLGAYFQDAGTEIILAADILSLPMDISSTLALILAAELGQIPVICLNGSFFWEQKPATNFHLPSVCFDRNKHLPEITSILETLYPWDSPLWVHANASEAQSMYLKETKGINPARVHTLPTVVDTKIFHPDVNKNERAAIYNRLGQMFGSEGTFVETEAAHHFEPASFLSRQPLILGSKNNLSLEICPKTFVLLQPTRIIPARRVERDLDLLLELSRKESQKRLLSKYSNILLLITGRIGMGYELYFEEFISKIAYTFSQMDSSISKNFFVGFLFGQLVSDSPDEKPSAAGVSLSQIYTIADLVLLPSETEGRALPIREAAASGVPIVSTHFSPEAVYLHVIGSPEEPEQRLQIITLRPGKDRDAMNEALDLLLDQKKLDSLRAHNMKVAKLRFSQTVLIPAWRQILTDMWILSQKQATGIARKGIEILIDSRSETGLRAATNSQSRQYLPGYWLLGYISTTQGLMEQSGHLVQERELRERIFRFALSLVRCHAVQRRKLIRFMMATEALFSLPGEEATILSDHSLMYRHRFFKKRLHEDLTEQQIMGAVGNVAKQIFGPDFEPRSGDPEEYWEISQTLWGSLSFHANTWVKRLRLLSGLGALSSLKERTNPTPKLLSQIIGNMSQFLPIDDASIFLQEVVHQPRHLMHFTGSWKTLFFELLILGQYLLEHWRAVTARTGEDYSITFVARETTLGDRTTTQDLKKLLELEPLEPLKKAMKEKRFQIIASKTISFGTDLGQLGEKVLSRIKLLRQSKGMITASGDHNTHTLDLLDLPCFRFGTITESPAAALMGIPKGASYLQFVPRRIRPTIGHPFSLQTSKDFSCLLNSPSFRTLDCLERGKGRAWSLIEAHSELTASPAQNVLSESLTENSTESHETKHLQVEHICGRHDDGLPYTAVIARLNMHPENSVFSFALQNSRHAEETVLDIALRYEGETGNQVAAAWNGGYMINEKVMHQLGLSKELLGSPLGLLMINSCILSPPLFNRPALAFDKNGRPHIARLKLNFSGSVKTNNPTAPRISWKKSAINPEIPPHDETAIYTLNHSKTQIPLDDRAILVLAGRHVTDIILPDETTQNEIELNPMGLHLSVNMERYYDELADTYFPGTEIVYDFDWPDFWKDMIHAIEAGPLLLQNNRMAIDLRAEGWKTRNSRLTQSGRVDLENLRSPKLGVGLTRDSEMIVLAVNGRIRDSVGATYRELAGLLREQEAFSAMSFDPGGSVTLVTNGIIRNIPPYCSDIESSPYVAPAEPKPVGRAVLATYTSEKERI